MQAQNWFAFKFGTYRKGYKAYLGTKFGLHTRKKLTELNKNNFYKNYTIMLGQTAYHRQLKIGKWKALT